MCIANGDSSPSHLSHPLRKRARFIRIFQIESDHRQLCCASSEMAILKGLL